MKWSKKERSTRRYSSFVVKSRDVNGKEVMTDHTTGTRIFEATYGSSFVVAAKSPFCQLLRLVCMVTIMLLGFSIPYIPPFANASQLVTPRNSFIGFLAAELMFYCLEVQEVKMLYVRAFGRWL